MAGNVLVNSSLSNSLFVKSSSVNVHLVFEKKSLMDFCLHDTLLMLVSVVSWVSWVVLVCSLSSVVLEVEKSHLEHLMMLQVAYSTQRKSKLLEWRNSNTLKKYTSKDFCSQVYHMQSTYLKTKCTSY